MRTFPGDFIYVLWNISESQNEVVNENFKALVLSTTPLLTKSTDVIATGTIQYLPTKTYESSTHVVSFLSSSRIQSTFSSSEFCSTPTPWSYSPNVQDEEKIEHEIFEQFANGTSVKVDDIRGIETETQEDQIEKLRIELFRCSSKIHRLSEYVFDKKDIADERTKSSVRSYITMNLFNQHQKRINTRVRRISSINQNYDGSALAIGSVTRNFLKASTPCSYETFKLIFHEYDISISPFPEHNPTCFPSKPYLSVKAPFHEKYTITCPTFLSLCVALGITDERVRREVLWNQEKGALRLIGSLVYEELDENSPAFILLGRSSVPHRILSQQDNANSVVQSVRYTAAKIQDTTFDSEAFRFFKTFEREEIEHCVRATNLLDKQCDSLSSIKITWEESKCLKRKYRDMISCHDILGTLSVSVPTCTTTSKTILSQLEKIFSPRVIQSCVSL